jgi:hypothetical protein
MKLEQLRHLMTRLMGWRLKLGRRRMMMKQRFQLLKLGLKREQLMGRFLGQLSIQHRQLMVMKLE